MKQLLRWLKLVEFMTVNLYSKSVEIFKEDKKLSKFLQDLADDEAYQYHFICSASQYLQILKLDIPLDIAIDEDLKKKIEAPLVEYTLLLETNRMHKSTILEAIIEIESSELNEILSYAVKMLTKLSIVYQYTATKLQTHKRRIYKYFKSIREEFFFINTFTGKKDLWKCKILIVDNNEIVGNILKELLKKKVKIVTSRNYSDGIKKLHSNYFDIIIANFNVTDDNGITFYNQTTQKNNKLKDNFIFYADTFELYEQGFLSMHNIPFLNKPISLEKLEFHIKNKVGKCLLRI